jgi:hypothetical protein
MSEYFYDAGAVVDMNNLVAGCLLPTPIQNCQPCSIPLEPAQVPAVPQGQVVVVPVAESETTF